MKFKKVGFTLVEILVVVAIIGILATIVIISFGNAQAKTRDARRMADLDTMNSAILLYYNENRSYPSRPNGCNEWSGNPENSNYWGVPGTPCLNDTFIVGLANYLSVLPKDPGPYCDTRGYFYLTDITTNYKLWIHSPENFSNAPESIWDPNRDGGTNHSVVDGDGTTKGCGSSSSSGGWAWAKYTPAWADED